MLPCRERQGDNPILNQLTVEFSWTYLNISTAMIIMVYLLPSLLPSLLIALGPLYETLTILSRSYGEYLL
jgi:hypothetical protein